MTEVQVQLLAAIPAPAGPEAAATAASVDIGGGGIQFPATSLYVGDLEANVTDAQLFDIFSQVVQVVSVRVCRDNNTRRSLGYAYVNFGNPEDAAKAFEMLNFTPLNGKAIRIMYSNRDPNTRKSGTANIFIKNLDMSIDNKALYDTFNAFGNILSCKVATESSGQSKGYGFVQFEEEKAAESAIAKLNGMLMNGKKVFVGPYIRKQERDNASGNITFNNVFVKNLSETTTDDKLEEIFGAYGKISSCVVMKYADGKSKCFGFVNFMNSDDAAKAVQELNGKKFDDKEWYVGRAQKKSEREMELKARFEQAAHEVVPKIEGTNLYLKNLHDSIDDDKLKDLFKGYGIITSYKVMRDPNGVSKGSAFVAFESPEYASKALLEMSGKMVVGKPLYVALAQRKEERRARLQAQFAQMRPVALPPAIGHRMPIYSPGAPGIGQPLFYGQTPPAFIPQPGFGFQQPPRVRPGTSPVPNFYMPMVQQGQPPQRPSGRRPGFVQHVPQHHVPMLQRGGPAYRYPPGRNLHDVAVSGVAGGMLSVPYDFGGMPIRDASVAQPIPIGTLSSALANASPEHQRRMLGESLYPLVDQLEHEHAAKVTGMLLELDQTEVLHLLESPEGLQAKVAEAMDVLRNVAQQQQAGSSNSQLAALSLNDVVFS